jgi:Fe-S-cluster containining protein
VFINPKELKALAKGKQKENIRLLSHLKKFRLNDVDNLFHEAHEEVFENMDCLACANCCKTTSPIFYPRDIERMAVSCGIKPGAFTEKYLRIDEEGDYVLKQAPCPFLDENNYCTHYNSRPNACREYPHTNRKKMEQLFDLTVKNTLVCPAVFQILEKLKKVINV